MTALLAAANLPAQGFWLPPFNHKAWPDATATDHLIPFGGYGHAGIQYFTTGGVPWSWPAPGTNGIMFKAVHMGLITKGQRQGKVMVLNHEPVLVRNLSFGPALPMGPGGIVVHYWSCQAYSIVDPADQAGTVFRNFLLPIAAVQPLNPSNPTDEAANLFCSGHAWSPFGDWIVVGGTIWSPSLATQLGPKITYVWNPKELISGWPPITGGSGFPGASLYPGEYGLWERGPDLREPRWYPTTTLSVPLQRLNPPREVMVILGGSSDALAPFSSQWNNYEALRIDGPCTPGNANLSTDIDILNRSVWHGPGTYTGPTPNVPEDWLHEYPRCHLLSDGRILFSGYAPRWATIDHDNSFGSWLKQGAQPYSTNWQLPRLDGMSVLYPNIGGLHDVVVRLGGADGHFGSTTPYGSTDTVEAWFPNSPGTPFWLAQPPMPNPHPGVLPDGRRYLASPLLLPDGSLMVIGGSSRAGGNAGDTAIYEPLLWNGSWSVLPSPQSVHDYHSAALLLPDGRVIVGGGESRSWDYEIYVPECAVDDPNNPRPQNAQFTSAITFNPNFDAYEIASGVEYSMVCDDLPLGVSIEKVVLMAPGSATHSTDFSMRYHELAIQSVKPNEIKFTRPAGQPAQNGPYMLFLKASNGKVSVAVWVHVS